MNKLFLDLEFDKIISEIKEYSYSSLGKSLIDNISLYNDLDDLILSNSKVEEAIDLISNYGRLPMNGFIDINNYVEIANKNGILKSRMLLDILNHLSCVSNIKNYLDQSELETIHIQELINNLEYNASLHSSIERCIDEDGSVKDHASNELYTIREKIRKHENDIHVYINHITAQNKDYLSLDQYTYRNDRFVLPLKINYKSKVKGIVHSYSQSGNTVYIEPEGIVELNNEIELLKVDETEEINKILFNLSQVVKQYYYHLKFNSKILQELDFIFAKAYYGYIHQCTMSQFSNTIQIMDARHPLLDQNKVISNNIIFNDKKVMIITGSNTGGKTVVLKTIGLLSLMALCSIPVTASYMSIPLFKNIYVDLIDEQSIEQSLSTFSSHMSKIADILKKCDQNSLVILDEIGSGTDPIEGEALALSVIENIIDKGSFFATTTHYSHIKSYAIESGSILSACVSFDKEKMRPTYHLYLDQVGDSYALEIAERLGIDHSIIDKAKDKKDSFISEPERLLQELSKRELLLKDRETILESKEQQLNEEIQSYNKKLDHLNNQKDKILNDAKNDANKLLEEAKSNIDRIVKDMKGQGYKQHIVNNSKKEIDQLKFNFDDKDFNQDHDLKTGDHVFIVSMNREADIIEIGKNHSITVNLNGLPIKLSENDVRYLHDKTKITKVESVKKQTIHKKGSYELNIIGERYEDAMNITSKFLDDAIVLGYPSVRIIHGLGKGILKKGVRKLLDQNKSVDYYRDGGPTEGGLGATLVFFK